MRQRNGEEVKELELPEVDPAVAYLVRYWDELGRTEGQQELSATEMRDWAYLSGVELDDFGTRALKAMSRAFLDMYHRARAPDCPCPTFAVDMDELAPEDRQARRDEVANKLDAWFTSADEAHGKKKKRGIGA